MKKAIRDLNLILVGLVIFILAIVVLCVGGCSANYWGGETSGKRPGVVAERTLFGAKVEMTSDGTGSVERVAYSDKAGNYLEINDLKIDQKPSDVVKEEPAKIMAIAEIQRTQTEYVKELTVGIKGIVSEIMPVFQLLAMAKLTPTSTGFNMTLPSGVGFETYKNKSPQEMQDLFNTALKQLETLRQIPTSQPVSCSWPAQKMRLQGLARIAIC